RNPNPYPVVLMERVDATVHITPCSSNMAPDAPIMVNHRGAQHWDSSSESGCRFDRRRER
ncbi:MAG: hypothetical protein ACYDEY_11850, partial [Acidimicrobiales bacterium]